MSDIPTEKRSKLGNKVVHGPLELVRVTVREAVKEVSVGHGQGFIRCACSGTCKQASRCSCRAAGLACSSKCHGKEFECSNNTDISKEKNEEKDVQKRPKRSKK